MGKTPTYNERIQAAGMKSRLCSRLGDQSKQAGDDRSLAVRGTDNSSQTMEEPDEVTNLMSGFEAERREQPRRLV